MSDRVDNQTDPRPMRTVLEDIVDRAEEPAESVELALMDAACAIVEAIDEAAEKIASAIRYNADSRD